MLTGLVFGLGMSVHIMTQMGFAVVMAWLSGKCICRKVSVWTIAAIALCWIAGAVLFWVVVAIEYRHSGSVADTISSAIWGRWGSAVFNIGRLGVLLKTGCMFFVLNFPTPLVFLAIPGVWLSFRQVEGHCAAGLLLACVVVYGAFAARYDIPNQNHFFLPMYMFVSVYIGLGYAFLAKRRPVVWQAVAALLLIAIPPTYVGLCTYARANRMALGTNRHIPYRDAYAYYLLPWQCGQTGPRRLVREVFEKVPKDSVLLCDSTIIPVFRYAHEVELQRPDVSVFRFHEVNDVWREMMDKGRSIFVFSDVEGYYPRWVEDKNWLRAYSISGSERVFEIVAPASRI